MKKLLPVLALLFFSLQLHASSAPEVIRGKVILKSWTKSSQSYCAQGSDYYVLLVKGEEHVLVADEPQIKKLKRRTGKKVKLRGEFITRTISVPDDDNTSQRPVSLNPTTGQSEPNTDFTCTVFMVQRVGKK